MHPITDPFQPGATKSIRRRPIRSHTLVVLDRNGCTFRDHPVAEARHSTLMVMDGAGDLVRNKPRTLAEKILMIPDVVPAEQRGLTSVDVPLINPDPLEGVSYTTWTVLPKRLLVDQSDAARAELSFPGPDRSDVKTLELRPHEWWHLARALVSLDAWMTYLREVLTVFSRDVRRARESAEPRVTLMAASARTLAQVRDSRRS